MIHVVWHTYTPGEHPDEKWDAGFLHLLFQGKVWQPVGWHAFAHHQDLADVPASEGAVVVFPAGIHRNDHDRLNVDLARFPWVLLILTADEGSLFETKHLHHPNLITWVMTPRPGRHYPPGTRFLGHGYRSTTPATLATLRRCAPGAGNPVDVYFAGQVNHPRRDAMIAGAKQLADHLDVELIASPGFAQGLPAREYLGGLAATRIALAPSGPVTPDSFRLYEALEAGVVPIADGICPDYDTPGYWELVLPGHPFPVVDDWAQLGDVTNSVLQDWQHTRNRIWSWWQGHKRAIAYWLVDDLAALGAPPPLDHGLDDRITVLVCSSPIPSHPDTRIIDQAIESIRERLPRAEILLGIDGIRPQQAHRRDAYLEHTWHILDKCQNEWTNVLPLVFEELTHQSGMAMRQLELTRTPLVFYVEHDLPLVGDIPLDAMAAAVTDGHADVIRLTINTDLEPAHLHLMLDDAHPQYIHGIPLQRTVQWSQQPHLATAAYYRDILGRYFRPGDPQYIELVMHSICAGSWHDHGELGWYRHRLWIYTPEGNMQRCIHTDGRETDPVFDTSGRPAR